MDARKLGQTDLEVSPIGLGCWQFSQGKNMTGRMWSTLDQGTMDAVVAAALDNGVTWFDTAQAYGNGASERALAGALKHRGVEPGRSGERILVEGEAACFYHAEKRATVACSACGRFLCALCDLDFSDHHFC